MFTNVNPEGRPRAWRIGDDFEAVARRFAPRLRDAAAGRGACCCALLRVTKRARSAYDALMLQLHDRMKGDDDVPARRAAERPSIFRPGSTWMAFTDQVSHAAMAGQYQLEQTFLLPVDAMRSPGTLAASRARAPEGPSSFSHLVI